MIEKPRDVSFEEIRNVLQQAHSVNFQKGIIMHTTELNAQELEKYLGDEGKCYIALDGNKIVGTGSLRIREKYEWFVQGRYVDEILVGILPEYSGKHIYSALYNAIELYAKENNYSTILFNTASKNRRKQRAGLKKGFKYVSYFVAEDNDHYSVVMAKWLDGRKVNRFRLWYLYNRRKWSIILRYKPGKVKRFSRLSDIIKNNK